MNHLLSYFNIIIYIRSFCYINCFEVFLSVAVTNVYTFFLFSFFLNFFPFLRLYSFRPNLNIPLAFIAFLTSYALTRFLISLSLDLTRCRFYQLKFDLLYIWSWYALYLVTICFGSANDLLCIWPRSALYPFTICFISAHYLICTWPRYVWCLVFIYFDFEYVISCCLQSESNKCIAFLLLLIGFEVFFQGPQNW